MSYNTVLLKGDNRHFQEDVAAGAITPGHLIEFDSVGEVQVNSVASDEDPALMFAMEDSLQGKEITQAYAENEIVKHITVSSGEEVYAIASGAVAIGDKVESAGDGTLSTKSSGSGRAVAVAKTAAADGERFVAQVL